MYIYGERCLEVLELMNIARKFLSMFSQEIVEAGLEFVEKSSY
jgi:hypothetical protein